ncbi:MAG: hypothetical protein F4Y44_05155 [Chloroflexi bacterium]|nr:hypothetical protein [Chloroflexota bacterium]
MTQADRIRQFVANNYIEPARRAGEEYVTVRAGDVDKSMVNRKLLPPMSRLPNVVQVLGGKKLQDLVNVELVDWHGKGTNTTFLYLIRQPFYARTIESASPRRLESSEMPRLPEPKSSLTSRIRKMLQ